MDWEFSGCKKLNLIELDIFLFSLYSFVPVIVMNKSGYRCEWCGMTTHSGCRSYISNECTFGVLQPIYLPPHAVSIPRTEVPMEAIIGVQVRSRSTPLQRDYSCRKYFPIKSFSFARYHPLLESVYENKSSVTFYERKLSIRSNVIIF